MVRAEAWVDQAADSVVDHLLAVGKAQTLRHAALHLPGGGDRVDHPPYVHHHQHPLHGNLTGLGVHRHLDELSAEGRWTLIAHVGGAGDDLMLILLVEAAQGHLGQRE